MIQAITTRYNGYQFRSRTEARWAVFFDAMNIKYQFEPQGYDLPSGKYLPDFFLPRYRMWVEIKGTSPSALEINHCRELSHGTKQRVLLIVGQTRSYSLIMFSEKGINVRNLVNSPVTTQIWCSLGRLKFYELKEELMIGEILPYKTEDYDVKIPLRLWPMTDWLVLKKISNLAHLQTVRLTKAYEVANYAQFDHGRTPQKVDFYENDMYYDIIHD